MKGQGKEQIKILVRLQETLAQPLVERIMYSKEKASFSFTLFQRDCIL